MDKYITSFLDIFGTPENVRIPGKSYIDEFRGKLPPILLSYWEEIGFCNFMDGFFQITDPNDYKEVLANWILNSSLRTTDENFYVIACSGFGDLYVFGEKTGLRYEINIRNGWIIKSTDEHTDLDESVQRFFASKSPYSIDLEDDETGDEMFVLATKKFGALQDEEIFGFNPILVAGGRPLLANLQKVNLSLHSDVILQFIKPQVITNDDLARMAFT